MKDNKDTTMLVSEAKEGSQAAYEALYQKTKQMVYFTCFSLLNSEADAADQMQETYATAFQKLDMLDDPEKFSGWINRIAINKCKNFLVQHKQWLPLSEEKFIPAENSELEKAFLPEAYIMQQDKREIVQRIMREELSDVQYRTILLYYYDELSLAEIAEWMECSEGTVKSRLHKAKELIREGVLKYSKKHDDTLYCIAVLPFLARLLQLEAEQLQAPVLNLNYLQNPNGQNLANQQTPKQNLQQDAKLQGKGKLVMEQKGLLSTTAGKAIAVTASLLVIGGGIAGVAAITANLDEQRVESQENYDQENNNQENNNQENTGQENDGQETADEASERLNEETNAAIEVDQSAAESEAEEQAQQLEEEYTEGILPAGKYICEGLRDEGSDIYVDEYVISLLEYGYFSYTYITDTNTYIIFDDEYKMESLGTYYHHLEGFLNDDGNFVATYYARYNKDILYKEVGYMLTDARMFLRFEECRYPDIADIVLDDIEWIYVYEPYSN